MHKHYLEQNLMWDNLLGQIYTDYVYDNSGNKVVSANGRYAASGPKSLGSIVPDYNMGLRIRFVKNFNLVS
jgi:hypothetical protein